MEEIVAVNPFRCPQYLKQSKQNRAPCRPGRDGVRLCLEALEDRWLPSGTITPTPPPPTFIQAALQLYSDGVNLGIGWVNQTVFHIDAIDAYPVPPADLNASIAFNAPYVGAFAPLFVLTGEIVGAEVQYQIQLQSLQTF